MGIFDFFKPNYKTTKKEKSLSFLAGGKVQESFGIIPEPTRSLLFFTDESVEKHVSPMTYEIRVKVTNHGISTENNEEDKKQLFAEPSLIWLKLPIEKNSEKTQEKMYYPSYFYLTPKQRYEYLAWLRDVTQPINLSYVFLYYYGLERQLVLGNYELAVKEINRLIEHHDKGSFKFYASSSLIASGLYHKRYDILEKAPFISDVCTNALFYLLLLSEKDINVNHILELSTKVGFKNKRYIKLYPEKFKKILKDQLDNYILKHGPVLSGINKNTIRKDGEIYFANLSFPKYLRMIYTPQIISDKNFSSILLTLLQDTHKIIKSDSTL